MTNVPHLTPIRGGANQDEQLPWPDGYVRHKSKIEHAVYTGTARVYDPNGNKIGKAMWASEHEVGIEKGYFFPTIYVVPAREIASITESGHFTLKLTMEEMVERYFPGGEPRETSGGA